jgi:protocatechuate 3,4-dioxygenase beta subunit
VSRRRAIPLLVAAVALVAAALALLLRDRSAPEPPVVAEVERTVIRPAGGDGAPVPETVRGGVYGGRVVDEEGRPVGGAKVYLVAESRGERSSSLLLPDGSTQPVPEYGNHFTASEPTLRTDADGRFRASGGDAYVVAVVASHPAHAPGILTAEGGDPLPPGEDLVVTLPPPGRLVGRLVDARTGAPVPNARVTISVQTPSNQEEPGPRPFTATNAFARIQAWTERELAPEAWGIESQAGEQGLHVWSDREGVFRFGPVSDEVQLEVVVTHPEYMWTDFDPEVRFEEDARDNPDLPKPPTRRRRLVIPAGQTVERTFELHRGKEITGVVVDGGDRGIPDVAISLEHIVQEAQHHFYRSHARRAVTDERGRFRFAGLARGPYSIRLQHLSFGTIPIAEAVPEGARDYEIKVPTAGFVAGRIEGGPEGRAIFPATVRLEPVVQGPRRTAPRTQRLLAERGAFRVDRVDPGTWRIWANVEGKVSVPETIEVRPSEATEVTLSLAEGGTATATVVDVQGRVVDPATLSLRPLDPGGVGGGQVLSRGGELRASGLPPGRYGGTVSATGFLDREIEPFSLAAGGAHDLGRVEMRRLGYLRIASLLDEAGRVPSVEVATTVQEGEKPPVAKLAMQGLIPVAPGRVTVRAKAADGRGFEEAFDVGDGETVDVRIVLRAP